MSDSIQNNWGRLTPYNPNDLIRTFNETPKTVFREFTIAEIEESLAAREAMIEKTKRDLGL